MRATPDSVTGAGETYWRGGPGHGRFRGLENAPARRLLRQLIGRGLIAQVALAAFLFVPGTLRFWQGWLFLATQLLTTICFCVYYYRRDPEFLARRLLRKEKTGAQKVIVFLLRYVAVLFYVVCGLDNRCGWSRTYLWPVPRWLSVLAVLLYAGSYALFIPIFNANRFAASVVQVEAGQTVADQGPYRWLRHPMYAVSLLVWLCLPLALGSTVALPAIAFIFPILVFRLLHEEGVLRRELAGYADYCRRTPWRLIPFVW